MVTDHNAVHYQTAIGFESLFNKTDLQAYNQNGDYLMNDIDADNIVIFSQENVRIIEIIVLWHQILGLERNEKGSNPLGLPFSIAFNAYSNKMNPVAFTSSLTLSPRDRALASFSVANLGFFFDMSFWYGRWHGLDQKWSASQSGVLWNSKSRKCFYSILIVL